MFEAPVAPQPAAPVYEAPVAPQPVAPVYEAPVQPQPAAPVFEAPVAPQPVAPVYEAPVAPQPAAPVFEAPVAPQPVAPVYEAPVQPQLVTPMHQQMPQGYVAPQTTPEKPKKSNTPIIVGAIAAVIVIILAVVLVFVLGDKDKDDDDKKDKKNKNETEQVDDNNSSDDEDKDEDEDEDEEDVPVVDEDEDDKPQTDTNDEEDVNPDAGLIEDAQLAAEESLQEFLLTYVMGYDEYVEDIMPEDAWYAYMDDYDYTYQEAIEAAETNAWDWSAAAYFETVEDLTYDLTWTGYDDFDVVAEKLYDKYGIDASEIDDVMSMRVAVSFECEDGSWEDEYDWYAVEIDGQWYICNEGFYFY